MKILITGATGFIGSAFARLALNRGHFVAGLKRSGTRVPAWGLNHPNIRWISGTIESCPWQEINEFRPDTCVHTAWITAPGVYLESPENERFRDISLEFLGRLVGDGIRQVVTLGTCIEYQSSTTPLREDITPLAPTTTYSRCKNELRLALERLVPASGFRLCWARVFYPYGPGEHPSRLCSSILHKLGKGEPVLLKTPQSRKDYIYVDDVAAAIGTLVETGFAGTVNLGTGGGVTVRQIASLLGNLVGRPELITEALTISADPYPVVIADATKLRNLGWMPSTSIDDGLRRLAMATGMVN